MSSASTDLSASMPSSDDIGGAIIRKPTFYIFPAGSEDSALFGVSGFSILLDGGFFSLKKDAVHDRCPSYWNLIRHYERVNVILLSQVRGDSLRSIATLFERKAQSPCYPHIGAVIGNLPLRSSLSAFGENTGVSDLRRLYSGMEEANLSLTTAHATSEPLVLYKSLGLGALNMIVLNPDRSGKELQAVENTLRGASSSEALHAAAAAACLALILVWHPDDLSQPTSRILYPSGCPLERLYAALEKHRNVDFLKTPCFVRSQCEKKLAAKAFAPATANAKPGGKAPPPSAPPAKRSAPPATVATAPIATRRAPVPTMANKSVNVKPRDTAKTTANEPLAKKQIVQPAGGASLSRGINEAMKKAAAAVGGGGVNKPAAPPKEVKPAPIRKPPAPKEANVPATGQRPTVIKKVDEDIDDAKNKPPGDQKGKHASGDKKEKPTNEPTPAVVEPTKPTPPPVNPSTPTDHADAHDQEPKAVKGSVQPKLPADLLDDVEPPQRLMKISMDTDDLEKALRGEAPTEQHQNESSLIDFEPTAAPANYNVSRNDSNPIMKDTSPFSSGLAQSIATDIADPILQELNSVVKDLPANVQTATPQQYHLMSTGIVSASSDALMSDENVDLNDGTLDDVLDNLVMQSHTFDSQPVAANRQLEELKQQWGEPLGLPPPPGDSIESAKTPAVAPKADATRTNALASARTTRAKPALSQPVYFDVVYIPHMGLRLGIGNDEASSIEFFTLIRSRYYVLSTTECTSALLDGWLRGKRAWKHPEVRSELIPTHDSDVLTVWLREHEEELLEEHMDVRPSASRCQIQLVGAESDTCAAYKIEL